MSHIATDKVQMFPSTKRATVDKLLSERAMTRFVNCLSDTDGFIIADDDKFDAIRDYAKSEWTGRFEFYIHGYFFSIESVNDLPADDDLWARIILNTENPDFTELEGQDEGGVYKGLIIDTAPYSETPGEHEEVHEFQILKGGKIPWSAFCHSKAISVRSVDGGFL